MLRVWRVGMSSNLLTSYLVAIQIYLTLSLAKLYLNYIAS